MVQPSKILGTFMWRVLGRMTTKGGKSADGSFSVPFQFHEIKKNDQRGRFPLLTLSHSSSEFSLRDSQISTQIQMWEWSRIMELDWFEDNHKAVLKMSWEILIEKFVGLDNHLISPLIKYLGGRRQWYYWDFDYQSYGSLWIIHRLWDV